MLQEMLGMFRILSMRAHAFTFKYRISLSWGGSECLCVQQEELMFATPNDHMAPGFARHYCVQAHQTNCYFVDFSSLPSSSLKPSEDFHPLSDRHSQPGFILLPLSRWHHRSLLIFSDFGESCRMPTVAIRSTWLCCRSWAQLKVHERQKSVASFPERRTSAVGAKKIQLLAWRVFSEAQAPFPPDFTK